MKKLRILFVVFAMGVCSLAHSQETMKKSDKNWADLEKHLADIND